jgi:predicted PurR-regulated permease PerM
MAMDEIYFRKIMTTVLLIVLIVLSFFLLKPILLSIVIALILALVFSPVYDWLYKKTKARNLSVFIIIAFLITVALLPLWFLTPIIIEQSFVIFQATQQIDFVTPLKNIFPSLFASDQFSAEIGSILSSFTSRVTNLFMNSISDIILNFPTIALQLVVVFFTFFFVLRDKDILVSYVQSLLPFSKEVEKKLFESSKGITFSVIYGQIIVGIAQGLVVGIGFFLFGVPNALFFTLLAIMAGIFPIIGTTIVWLPIMVYFVITGNTFPALGILLFGLISSTMDNFLRPIIVSRRTKMHSALVLIGMIGGLFLFGIIGVILGPLIIAYLLILLELYRNKRVPGILLQREE